MVIKTIPALVPSHKYATLHRPTLRTQSKSANYGLAFDDYEDLLSFLEREEIKTDSDLVLQVIALLESEWRPAVEAARDEFYERIQCCKCGTHERKANGWNRKISPDGERKLDALIEEMRRLSVEKLTVGRVMGLKKRFGELEKEYLDAHLGRVCKGSS